MLLLLVAAALAVDLPQEAPVELVRVADPAYPGAIAHTAVGSLLEAPPTDGTPWHYETFAVPDGWPGDSAASVVGAPAWHAAGWRGAGVHVAVFDVQWNLGNPLPDTLTDSTTADCFAHLSCDVPFEVVAPRFAGELGAHGVACAQAVREVAPDARISLVRVIGYSTLASAVDWAIRNDVDVISMSLSFFNDSFYDGGGPFRVLAERLAAHNILLVTSAGNYARQHWSGRWKDRDGNGRLDFDGTNALPVAFNGGGRRTVYVNWDEHTSCGDSDLDVWVLDRYGFIVGRGERVQSRSEESCDPVERVQADVASAGTYQLVVKGQRVSSAWLEVDVLVLGGQVLEPKAGGSVVDPGSNELVFTVGAVDAWNYLSNPAEGFSSRGPTNGGLNKPDIAGPDGLTDAVYGTRGFFGTSAATPAVAGALALVLSRERTLTPAEGGARLQAWAWGHDAGWDDPALGAGKVRLPVPGGEALGCVRGGSGSELAWLPLVVVWRRRDRSRSQG